MRSVTTAGLVAVFGLILSGCATPGASGTAAAVQEDPNARVTVTDLEVGTGRSVEPGDQVFVMYRGTRSADGVFFDGNLDDPESAVPFSFTAGQPGVIDGWQQGIAGLRRQGTSFEPMGDVAAMKEGGKRKIEIPAVLAYGSQGGGEKIPPNTDLTFEVHLLYVFKDSEREVFDFVDNTVGTGPEAKAGDLVELHYRGTYLSGKVWDDTRERGETVKYKLEPESRAIPGMIGGIIGMRAGGQRTLVLPHTLVFGGSGSAVVQGMQPVRIVVDLVSVNGQTG